MPEINPLSNEQIFLKKIAENTGSDYNTGDVSEINPITIDQILLKEIAANTEGLSGDITELEEKVSGRDYVEVTSDGVKTWGELFNALFALIQFDKVKHTSALWFDLTVYSVDLILSGSVVRCTASCVTYASPFFELRTVEIRNNNNSVYNVYAGSLIQLKNEVPTSGMSIKFIY